MTEANDNYDHKTVNIKPTWLGVVNVCIMAIESGSPIGYNAACHELREIGRYMDSHVPDNAPVLQSHWDENPDWPVEDWQIEVANDDTRLGYLDWVAARQIEEEAELHRNHRAATQQP